MSSSKKMLLRVQSPEGTSRVEVKDTDVTAYLFERIYEDLELNSFAFTLHKDRQRQDEILSSKSKLLRDCGLRHGDMIYLNPVNGAVLFEPPSTSSEVHRKIPSDVLKPVQQPEAGSSTSQATLPLPPPRPGAPQEDDVDLQLYKMSGLIERQRDEKLCRHNVKGRCVHCTPLEPWDEEYLKEHNIKHMSFHSYLRKITSKTFISLEELSCKIKPGCREHPAWPRGICSKCQPGAVTLMRQTYRHTDNVLFEHAHIVERFLAYWRATGHQRLAWLYGRYESHPDVPLGIRARVAAIYEPPQSSSRDSIVLETDPREELLEQIAHRLGLRRVGWIFTDLVPLDVEKGTVKHIRGVDSHFLSAQECITAGHYQNLHPNACRHATSGYFGSKFVTVCVSGDSSSQVHLEGYQVSGQCGALVRDDVLLPTRDAPDLAYVRDSSAQQYVPDLYYKERDEYGNEVGVSAKRLPVAYLLVDVPCGVAGSAPSPAPTFTPGAAFPPANRPLHHHLQTLQALHRHIDASDTFLEAMSDLHVLLYLASNEALALGADTLHPLLDAVRARDGDAAEAWRALPSAATLLHLAAADTGAERLGAGSEVSVWTCGVCTFHNPPAARACDMCAMPRNNAM